MDHEKNLKYCKIVEQNETGEIILHQNNLQTLIDTWSKIRKEDDPISLVSFIGPQSCGKSFFSNLFIEYVRMYGSLSWTRNIKRKGLQGFSYGVGPNAITAGQLIPEKDINAIYFYPELLKLNAEQREEFICILHVHRGDQKSRNKEVDIALDALLGMMSSVLVNIMWNDKNTLSDINQLVTDPKYLAIKDHLTGNVANLLRGEGVRDKNVIHLEESPSLHDKAGLVKLSYQQYSAVNNLMKAISASQNATQVQTTLSNILERFKKNIEIINVCNGFNTSSPSNALEPVKIEEAPKRETKSIDEHKSYFIKVSKRQNEFGKVNVRMPKDMEDKIKRFFSSQFSEQARPGVDHWINNDLINQNFTPIYNESGSFLQYFNEQNITKLFSDAKEEFQKNQKLINQEILECIQNFYMIMNTQFEDVPHFGGNALRKALNETLTCVTSDLKFSESKERIIKASRNMFKVYYERNSVKKSATAQSQLFDDVEKCHRIVSNGENLHNRYRTNQTRRVAGYPWLGSDDGSNSEREVVKPKSTRDWDPFRSHRRRQNDTSKLTSIPAAASNLFNQQYGGSPNVRKPKFITMSEVLDDDVDLLISDDEMPVDKIREIRTDQLPRWNEETSNSGKNPREMNWYASFQSPFRQPSNTSKLSGIPTSSGKSDFNQETELRFQRQRRPVNAPTPLPSTSQLDKPMYVVGKSHDWGGRTIPLPNDCFEWQPCKIIDEKLANSRSLAFDQTNFQFKTCSKEDEILKSTKEKAQKVKQAIQASTHKFKSSIGKNIIIIHIDDILEALNQPGIQERLLKKHASSLDSIVQKYDLQI